MSVAAIHLGLYEKALPPSLTWHERLSEVRELGYDFMEMSIDETDQRLARLDWTLDERRAFRRLVEDSGLVVPSICLSAHRRFPFGSADPAQRERARDIMLKAIDLAQALGVRTLQLAGYDVYYEPSTPDSLTRFREGLAWAADEASAAQVMLAVEIMDTPLMGSITKWLAWKRDIPTPWFQVYPDLGNLSAWGANVPDELESGIEHIVAVHVKDTRPPVGSDPGQFKCVPFGDGCVDFVSAFATLKRLGYRGDFLVEMWAEASADPHAAAAAARRFVLGKLQEAGW
ncbi:MAG: ulaE [Proteobacteria bacterium]|nr:ulaE [Pseudomonadota bacterium]